MVQYDTPSKTLRFARSENRADGKWEREDFVLELRDVPENIRQLVVQVAKLSVSTVNGNNPSKKHGENSASQVDKLMNAVKHLSGSQQNPGIAKVPTVEAATEE